MLKRKRKNVNTLYKSGTPGADRAVSRYTAFTAYSSGIKGLFSFLNSSGIQYFNGTIHVIQ